MTYNKCKIFFISYGIDRFNVGVSPKAYSKEVQTLLDHIEKSHSDETYPVWFLSPRSSTSIPDEVISCTDSEGYTGRTPGRIHAFNEEARRILHDRYLNKSQSERHIHYMDNSDIMEAFWHIVSTKGHKEYISRNQQMIECQITSTVSMRCMEKITRQVKAWRDIKQIGTQNGLMRSGTLILNDELYKHPYSWGK